jgi:hypothetical protein
MMHPRWFRRVLDLMLVATLHDSAPLAAMSVQPHLYPFLGKRHFDAAT